MPAQNEFSYATMIVNKLNCQFNMGLPLNTCHTQVNLVSLTKAIYKNLGLEGSSLTTPPSYKHVTHLQLKEDIVRLSTYPEILLRIFTSFYSLDTCFTNRCYPSPSNSFRLSMRCHIPSPSNMSQPLAQPLLFTCSLLLDTRLR